MFADERLGKDTSHLAIIDAAGNAITMTPSDFPMSPMVPGTGLTLGNRMTQFRLVSGHPNRLQPGKRPRVTPHAVIVFRDGAFFMACGTPGGDMQPQALIQVFLNMAVFGMDIQQAIAAPRFRTLSMPSSFLPHDARPATLWIEQPLFARVQDSLRRRGYKVIERPQWDLEFGAMGAVLRLPSGFMAGSDPRDETWAGGR